MILDAQTALIAHLAEHLGASAHVEPLPENAENYAMSHPKAAVLVLYTGSSMSGALYNQRNAQFDLYVITKNLNGASGLAHYVDAVFDAVHLRKLPGYSGKVVAVRDRFNAILKGLQQHVITVEMPLVFIRKKETAE